LCKPIWHVVEQLRCPPPSLRPFDLPTPFAPSLQIGRQKAAQSAPKASTVSSPRVGSATMLKLHHHRRLGDGLILRLGHCAVQALMNLPQ
jgi:hypothetical protein